MSRSSLKTSHRVGSAWVIGAVLVGSLHAAQARKAGPAEDACLVDVVCVGLYEEARRLSKSGDFATALAAYQGAHRRRPVPWLLINIGRTLHKLGRPAEALSHYRRYLSEEPKGPADRTQTVHDYIAQAEKAVADRAASSPAAPVEKPPEPAPAAPDGSAPTATPPPNAAPEPQAVITPRDPAAPQPGGEGATSSEPAPAASTIQPTAMAKPDDRSGTTGSGTPPVSPSSGTEPSGSSAATAPTAQPAASTSPPTTRVSQPRQAANGSDLARTDDGASSKRALPSYFWPGLGVGGALLVGGAAMGTAALVESGALQSTPFAGTPPSSVLDQQSRLRSFAISSDVLLAVGGTTVGVVTLVMLIQRYANTKQKR